MTDDRLPYCVHYASASRQPSKAEAAFMWILHFLFRCKAWKSIDLLYVTHLLAGRVIIYSSRSNDRGENAPPLRPHAADFNPTLAPIGHAICLQAMRMSHSPIAQTSPGRLYDARTSRFDGIVRLECQASDRSSSHKGHRCTVTRGKHAAARLW